VHHYGEDSTTVIYENGVYRITFRNKVSDTEIRMDIPDREVPMGGMPAVEQAAREIAHILRRTLE